MSNFQTLNWYSTTKGMLFFYRKFAHRSLWMWKMHPQRQGFCLTNGSTCASHSFKPNKVKLLDPDKYCNLKKMYVFLGNFCCSFLKTFAEQLVWTYIIAFNNIWLFLINSITFFFVCFYFSDNNNHAVLVVGYGPGYFLVKNSWGSNWGEDGFFKIKSGVGLCGFGWQLNSVPLC